MPYVKTTPPPTSPDYPHGQPKGYKNGCRCDACTAANRAAVAAQRLARATTGQVTHGPAGYDCGCRCPACKAGKADRRRTETATPQVLAYYLATLPEPSPGTTPAPVREGRTVHATHRDYTITRDQRGAWRVEPTTPGAPSLCVTMRAAAAATARPGVTWHPGRPKGVMFDAQVRRRHADANHAARLAAARRRATTRPRKAAA